MSLPSINLNQVPLGQFINFMKLLDELKPDFEKRFPEGSRPTLSDILTQYPEYVEKIVCFWTGWDGIKNKDFDLVLGVYSLIEAHTKFPEPEMIRSFELEGETYFAPQDLKAISKTVPMGKATFGQMLEALQLEQLANGKYDMMPFVLASLFTKAGESVDDFDMQERGELFKQLPVTTAISAYFFLSNFASTSTKHISNFLTERATQKQVRPA